MNNSADNISFVDTTAIILAGGSSLRMKKDKKFLGLPDGNLLDKAISNVKNHFAEIIISVSKNSKLEKKGVKTVKDSSSDIGPIMGIYTCLQESSNKKNFVVAVDIPEINIDLISKMYKFTDEFDIVVPVSKSGKYEPLFSFFNKNSINDIKNMIDLKIHKIVDLYPECKTKYIKMDNDKWMKNLNTEDDYRNYLFEIRGIK